MNYYLKELLGKQDPKLLQAACTISWQAAHSMRDTAVIQYESKRKLTIQLADHIIKAVPIAEDVCTEGLQFRVFVHTKEELEALLDQAYSLGLQRTNSI